MVAPVSAVGAAVVPVALEHHPDLRVVQFDAHPDLRSEYLGEAWNYASAMTRVLDRLGPDRLYQVGLRTGDREEWVPPRGTRLVRCSALFRRKARNFGPGDPRGARSQEVAIGGQVARSWSYPGIVDRLA